jgi:hypothetical protein
LERLTRLIEASIDSILFHDNYMMDFATKSAVKCSKLIKADASRGSFGLVVEVYPDHA